MKTILDAVNTLKGVWPGDAIQIIEIDGVEFSEKDFNAQVLRCSNNVGFPSATAIPIYTQVMFDNGELPSVGMECKIFYNEIDSRFNDFYDCVIEVIAITGDVFTFKNDLYGFGALKLKLKMLEVIRSDKEKAIDDLMDEQASLIGNIAYMKKSFGIAYDKWVK